LARTAASALLALLLGAGPRAASAGEQVRITDPYIELHTGPGRGYPVFHVAERDEKIEILLRHTDWYKVRTDGGQEGWVNRAQLETTLTAAGTAKVFRDVLVDDYLRRRLEMGAAWGLFDSEPMVKIWGGYRFADALSIEVTIGQVQGTFAGTELWNVNLNVEPWSDRRFSPFFGVGLGRFHNIPNLSLVNAVETTANLANAAVGLRYYIADRFVARFDYSIYSAYTSDLSSTEYRAATLGLAFFF
jgi:SH3-like domain-containing protein